MPELTGINPFYSQNTSSKMELLEDKFQEAQDKQGFIGNIWDDIKNDTNLGVSSEKCEAMLEKYQKGEITFEEATEYIEKFDQKQDNMSDLFANILTGTGAIAAATLVAATVATGGVTLPIAIAVGAPIGALIKTGLGMADRGTNKIEGDALQGKEIAKDVVSGALTGATSAVSSGIGTAIRSGNFGLAVANGTKCGLACGASSGAISYTANTLIDGKEFNFDELINNTATSAMVSGGVGALVGGGMYSGASLLGTAGEQVTKSTGTIIAQDCCSSGARKIIARSARDISAAVA